MANATRALHGNPEAEQFAANAVAMTFEEMLTGKAIDDPVAYAVTIAKREAARDAKKKAHEQRVGPVLMPADMLPTIEEEPARGRPPSATPWTPKVVRTEAIRQLAEAGVTWSPHLESALRARLGDTSTPRAREDAKIAREAFEAMERLAALTEKEPPASDDSKANASRLLAYSARSWLQANARGRIAAYCSPASELPRKMDRLRQNPRPELPQGIGNDHLGALLWLLGWTPDRPLAKGASVARALGAARRAVEKASERKAKAAQWFEAAGKASRRATKTLLKRARVEAKAAREKREAEEDAAVERALEERRRPR